jgi:hypothetical protein
MSNFDEIDKITSKEAKEKAKNAKSNQRAEAASLSQAYARLFRSDDGQKVMNDLYNKMVINNMPDANCQNINYMAAFKNGEAGCVSYIQKQITQAKVV